MLGHFTGCRISSQYAKHGFQIIQKVHFWSWRINVRHSRMFTGTRSVRLWIESRDKEQSLERARGCWPTEWRLVELSRWHWGSSDAKRNLRLQRWGTQRGTRGSISRIFGPAWKWMVQGWPYGEPNSSVDKERGTQDQRLASVWRLCFLQTLYTHVIYVTYKYRYIYIYFPPSS